jgi:hypothetical protein
MSQHVQLEKIPSAESANGIAQRVVVDGAYVGRVIKAPNGKFVARKRGVRGRGALVTNKPVTRQSAIDALLG